MKMNKHCLLLLGSLVVLSGCELPLEPEQSARPLPDSDEPTVTTLDMQDLKIDAAFRFETQQLVDVEIQSNSAQRAHQLKLYYRHNDEDFLVLHAWLGTEQNRQQIWLPGFVDQIELVWLDANAIPLNREVKALYDNAPSLVAVTPP
jgi:hypothetical protein